MLIVVKWVVKKIVMVFCSEIFNPIAAGMT